MYTLICNICNGGVPYGIQGMLWYRQNITHEADRIKGLTTV